MIGIILTAIVFAALVIGTITDIRTREVPDWINYSVIFSGIGIRALYSLITFDWMFLLFGLAGLALFVGVAYAMFYAGQWGGGDAKMMMALGVLIGFDFTFNSFPLILIFLINVLFLGAVYGLFFSIVFAVKHKKKFLKEAKKQFNRGKKLGLILIICSLFLAFAIFAINNFFNKILFLILIVLINAFFYLWIFVKSVELSSMFKYVEPEHLTEGDWIARDYKIDKEYICGPKDLGIEKHQINKLIQLKKKQKINKVKIKIGIPFVPCFLIAFIATVLFGAWWIYLF